VPYQAGIARCSSNNHHPNAFTHTNNNNDDNNNVGERLVRRHSDYDESSIGAGGTVGGTGFGLGDGSHANNGGDRSNKSSPGLMHHRRHDGEPAVWVRRYCV